MLGPNGATYQFGGQKGLSLEDRHSLEDQMNKMVLKLSELFPNAEKAASLEGSGALEELAMDCHWFTMFQWLAALI